VTEKLHEQAITLWKSKAEAYQKKFKELKDCIDQEEQKK